ncbi:PAS domain S-box protein [Ancylomarina salipaludis]|uniref:histidine kinase n=1 Tax=Ancylomarina salipaludis TaxID=2501299 RepID=A0A4Q1JQ91_9BACT|nr:PAS domain S-box protein [Ancylomarina salipaludis]RXQ96511.1 PAS domain S-box protein [Ancylomarina salipaludis]
MFKFNINFNPSLLRHILGVIFTLLITACVNQSGPTLTQDETNWLKQNEGKIEVLFGYQDPPSAFLNVDGDYVGLLVDYQKEIENYLGQKFIFHRFATWEKLITYSKTANNFIIIGCARTNKREKYLLFTNSIIKIPYVIISQQNRLITSMSSLADKNVCTVSDYAINDYLEQYYPHISPINYSRDLDCIRAVSTGICDAMIANQMSATYIINSEAISNLKISGESGYLNRLAIAVSNNDPILFKIIDKAVDNIPTNTHNELYKKWVNPELYFLSKKTWVPILTILLIFAAAFIILWLWLISLKKQVARQTQIIKKNEENLRITINSIGDGLIVTDINGKITRMNPIAEKLTGWQFKDVQQKNLSDIFRIINSKTREPIENPAKKIIKTGQIIGLANHTLLISKNGEEYQIADSVAPITDQQGKISGVVLVFRDITDTYRMQKTLEENEKRYRSLIENSNDGIFLFYNKKFEFVNKQFEQIMGYSAEEINNINFDIMISPESLDMIYNRLKEKNKDKLSSKFEFTGITKSGRKLPLEVSVNYIPYKKGVASQGIIRDITQRKRYEAELIKAKENAEESDRLKSVFLATMSHELRTPLNAVIGFSELIQADVPLDDILHFSKIISMSGKHLLGVIEDIFDISLIETGDIYIVNEPLNISTLLNEIFERIKTEKVLQDKEHLEIILDNSINEQDSILYADQKRIKQILINLLKNAIKFTQKGSISFGCKLSVKKQNKFIQFFVKDTGIGIPQHMQNLIFEVFRQADETHTRIYGGTGLGLTICKKLTHMMGGDIWVKSEEGRGANFHFTVPFKNTAEASPEHSNIHPELNFNNVTVLIAEDDKTSFSFLKALLSSKGMKCVWVKNGREAVKYCTENNPIDLLLMDINMPEMNGYIATSQIKTIRPKLPIIAQTAYAIEGDKENILAAGCDYYISKPINQNELFEKIRLCLEKNQIMANHNN